MHYELDKVDYLVGEPIFLRMQLENRGLELTYFNHEEVREYTLLDGAGNTIPVWMHWPHIDYIHREFVPGEGSNIWQPIKNGDSTELRVENILDHYGKGVGYFDYYLEPGEYAVINSRAKSDTVRFRVIMPTEPSDLQAWDLFKNSIVDDSMLYAAVRCRFFQQFLDKNPSSPWTERAVNRLILAMGAKTACEDSAQAQEYAIRLITEFPHSGFVEGALITLEPTQVRGEERSGLVAGLHEILAHYPSGYIALDARKALEALED
jgi:hypothetical protein